ncbi:hypothetical protein GUJ93_ZPchr0002g24282 [Zizania palustris]|uniref:Regulator of Vps4 activity in the MVB pathway protein n=1 Tax=Zizania palustris TaxID=103762 RepID=A0A8J5VRH9_ZIZPA|nr:hypothetical protein GUJ93_ZPchr0002g24282 [Zizania palustris]
MQTIFLMGLFVFFLQVEHVIREQNIMAANEIIDLFCELIVTRLPIIAKQKECPADLKEGICSLIFASPRCSELPELSRMCNLFGKKYGKDFVSAAVDLRPNACVNNLLIEKLSVKKPSGQTKLKVLKEIAKEHQIDWDMTETEHELIKPPEELIQGPSTFVEVTNLPVKTTLSAPVVQLNPSKYSSGYADDYDNEYTMQFKDVESAARAAAESAKRAASAAKAAADLANKKTHSSGEYEDRRTSFQESTHSSNSQSIMSNSSSSRSSRKEDAVAFDELKPQGRKASHTESFCESNHIEDKEDKELVDLGARRPPPQRNSRTTRKLHSEIKFDDSEGFNSETENESDMEIQSIERPAPRHKPYPGSHHSEEKETSHEFPDLPKANLSSCVHPNMPLDYETLTARFEALKSGKLP